MYEDCIKESIKCFKNKKEGKLITHYTFFTGNLFRLRMFLKLHAFLEYFMIIMYIMSC